MLTLQILDAGETFLHALDGRPLVLGSAPDADVRLTEAGVAPQHARLEPRDDGYDLVDLGSPEGTKVNGEPVTRVALRLGDRLELGRAVIVVGQRVPRRATARDVLADGPVARGRRRNRHHGIGPAFWVVAAVLALAVGAGGWWVLDSLPDRPPREMERVVEMRRQGDFDGARSLLAEIRRDWVDGVASRQQRIARAEERLEAVEAAVGEGRARLREQAVHRSYGSLLLELKAREEEHEDPVQREAARILRSDLRATIDGVRQVETGDRPVADGAETEAPGAGDEEDATAPDELAGEQVRELLAEAGARAEERRYAEALEMLRSGLAAVPPDRVDQVRARYDALRREVKAAMDRLIAAVEARAERGDLHGAIAHLEEEAWRFPGTGDMSALQHRLEALRAERTARARGVSSSGSGPEEAGEAPSRPALPLAELQDLIERAEGAEGKGGYREAAEAIDRAAELVGDRDALYATHLEGRAEDLDALATALEAIAGHVEEHEVRVPLPNGETARALGREGPLLVLVGPESERRWTLLELAPVTVAALAEAAGVGPEAWLGVGVHAYRHEQREAADRALVRALRGDADLAGRIDGILARGRGDRLDERGYELVDGAFVSVREIEIRAEAEKLQRRVAFAVRRSGQREELVDELMARGSGSLDAVIVAFEAVRDDLVEEIGRAPVRERRQELLEVRELLDRAREHALELIYDEERYFYPFRVPQVSAAKEAEYWEVQQEVDRRIAAVREIWEGRHREFRVPRTLGRDLDALEWVRGVLADLGAGDPGVDDRLAWVRALPGPGTRVTLQTIAWDAAELDRYLHWQAIEDYNREVERQLSSTEREQLRITNAYRRMMGHRPLALSPALHRAARGHSREMADLGYFSHTSPTPGRKRPTDRMRAEGYTRGVSENIARNDSARGAHVAWLHSSGHHRNLLNPNTTEFGIGVAGRHYTQNFGRGEDYKVAPEFDG